eukprot:Gb_04826 [translate_table: standard]
MVFCVIDYWRSTLLMVIEGLMQAIVLGHKQCCMWNSATYCELILLSPRYRITLVSKIYHNAKLIESADMMRKMCLSPDTAMHWCWARIKFEGHGHTSELRSGGKIAGVPALVIGMFSCIKSSLGSGDSNANLSKLEEDGIMLGLDRGSSVLSERALQEHLQQSAVGTMDDHLVEFSEALRNAKLVDIVKDS